MSTAHTQNFGSAQISERGIDVDLLVTSNANGSTNNRAMRPKRNGVTAKAEKQR